MQVGFRSIQALYPQLAEAKDGALADVCPTGGGNERPYPAESLRQIESAGHAVEIDLAPLRAGPADEVASSAAP